MILEDQFDDFPQVIEFLNGTDMWPQVVADAFIADRNGGGSDAGTVPVSLCGLDYAQLCTVPR
ncbi:MAG: hypothetical protein HC767_12310 [Akkermansiaceae bacterium]|nr:hypothetical protein [Akkermansiaceae bacterium]